MKDLGDHFARGGNVTRNISEDKQLKEFLHYKSKHTIAFESFVAQFQKMYLIYKNEGKNYDQGGKDTLPVQEISS